MPILNQLAEKLQTKLEQISLLEKQFAPKGVNFSVRGQEVHTSVSTAPAIRDPLAAADAVIGILKNVEALESKASLLDSQTKRFSSTV